MCTEFDTNLSLYFAAEKLLHGQSLAGVLYVDLMEFLHISAIRWLTG